MPYILYKNPISYDTLAIVQYLHYVGKPNEPVSCVERGGPLGLLVPSIFDTTTNKWYQGIDDVVGYYEECSGITNLLATAEQFKKENPDYTIHMVGGR